MSVTELIIKKIMRGENLGNYHIECAAIREHIQQLEAENDRLIEAIHTLETMVKEEE